MVREIRYDEVFDAQKHFRALLDSTARPGKINVLDPVMLQTPSGLNDPSALVAFVLMDASSTFDVIGMPREVAEYLAINTNARHVETEKAHFIFARGSETPDFLDSTDCGTLLYPDTGSTVVLQLENIATEPLPGSLRLALEGPGIDGKTAFYASGLNPDLLLALQARNVEFPMGIDTILTFADRTGAPAIAALPRTTRVSWKICQ